MNVLDILEERGFIDQTTHDQELKDCLDQGNVTCYIGFDPAISGLTLQPPVCILAVWCPSCPWRTCKGRATDPLR
jgi:tyrosyl-tRNA synthetase